MKIFRLATLVATFGVMGIAYAVEPPCFLRTDGSYKLDVDGTVLSDAKDSGFVEGAGSIDYSVGGNATANNSTGMFSGTGTAAYGELCLKSSADLAGTASVSHHAGATGGQVQFGDMIEFWNPDADFGKAMEWQICVTMTQANVSGIISPSSGYDAKGWIQLGDMTAQNVSFNANGSVLQSCVNYTIANGDAFALHGFLMHSLEGSTTTGGVRDFTLNTCLSVSIKALSADGKYMSCSGHDYPVPEPASMAALASGLAAVVVRRRRK
ncbi:MAG: PEP-CTERM sorting domain-containing protein [Armatimonadetes bacterium]|nr:PEP-CTERM sorting domain-containing protein [Armatimonadota bacterium]